jgi:hypothetical protein
MQAGSYPSACLLAHKSQFIAFLLSVLNTIMPKGQANRHNVQPVHFSGSSITLSRLKFNAWVGHAMAQGAGSQCLQVRGTAKWSSIMTTLMKLSPPFTLWQATSHPWQFMQRS